MPRVLQMTSPVTSDELLYGVEQLSLPDLEQFVSRVLALLARRKTPSLPKNEAELLSKINQGLLPTVQQRYDELTAKRRADNLTSEEHRELLELIDDIEKSDAKRVKYLAELARLRQTSLSSLIKDLEIRTPPYA